MVSLPSQPPHLKYTGEDTRAYFLTKNSKTMNKAQLIVKLKSAGVKESESPFTITDLGTIAVSELETFTSSKGNHYLKADNYLIAVKDDKILLKDNVNIKVIMANKDYKSMKAGDTFAVAE